MAVFTVVRVLAIGEVFRHETQGSSGKCSTDEMQHQHRFYLQTVMFMCNNKERGSDHKQKYSECTDLYQGSGMSWFPLDKIFLLSSVLYVNFLTIKTPLKLGLTISSVGQQSSNTPWYIICTYYRTITNLTEKNTEENSNK